MNKRAAMWAALAWGLATLPAAGAAEMEAGTELEVTTANAILRDAPRPFGAKALQTLPLGEKVKFKRQAVGAWLVVDHGGVVGFLPANSVAEAKSFSASSLVSRVSESDMAAATKGFNPEVEKRNRKENAKLRYDLMDKAEAMSTVADPMQTTTAFREEGRLGEFRKKEAKP
jgi:hypothetical protein